MRLLLGTVGALLGLKRSVGDAVESVPLQREGRPWTGKEREEKGCSPYNCNVFGETSTHSCRFIVITLGLNPGC